MHFMAMLSASTNPFVYAIYSVGIQTYSNVYSVVQLRSCTNETNLFFLILFLTFQMLGHSQTHSYAIEIHHKKRSDNYFTCNSPVKLCAMHTVHTIY